MLKGSLRGLALLFREACILPYPGRGEGMHCALHFTLTPSTLWQTRQQQLFWGLSSGYMEADADLYLLKPASYRELMARVKAILRRFPQVLGSRDSRQKERSTI